MIINKDSTKVFSQKNAGGKGYNLYLLTQKGFPIPEWRVVSASLFRQFCEENQLIEKIEKIIDETTSPADISFQVSALILNSPLSKMLDEQLRKAYKDLGHSLISVRSSAIGEDSAEHSFAGQLSSYLYIQDEETAITSIKKCWASAYSERGIAYRLQNNLNIKEINVAVVLQEMIDPQTSGVAFSCDPVTGSHEVIFINSVFGVGEGLVSGALEGDTFVLNKKTLETLSEVVAEKNQKMIQDAEQQSCKLVDLNSEEQNLRTLDNEKLKELVNLVASIETFYHYPQDIEWAIKDGKIYILQSRPVTTTVKNGEGKLFIWDNSNIVESYGGLTKPLTIEFARHVYHQVYVQFCEILLVPRKRIAEMDYFLKNMLGCFYGRVYYNLLNWYKLTSILPGFKFNRQFMETMMGTDSSLEDEIADRIKPPAFQETFSSKVRRFITGCKFFYFHLTAQSLVDKFLSHFYKHYEDYRDMDFDSMTPNEIIDVYYDLEMKFLRNWKAPIINDFLCMVHFGLLKKLTEKWLSQFGDGLQNDLLCGDGNLESAMPTREVIRLAGIVQSNTKLNEMIINTPSSECLEVLNQSEFKEFKVEIDEYISKYGFRCMSEMKLEQRDLHHNPESLFTFIKNHLNTKGPSIEELEANEKKVRTNAEKKVMSALSGVKKLIYKWSLKHARKAVRNRENTRFCRTRVYGIVRRMFYAIGADFTRRGILKADGDVFYLSFTELFGALEGYCPAQDLAKLVEVRKSEYHRYEEMEPASRFHTRGPVYWQNDHMPPEEEVDLSDIPENCLKGIPCCAGEIEGIVKVILNPEDDLALNGEILVAKRTDPGWVPLYPSASALLVERGGLLSHSAIVAREMGLPTIVSIKNLTEELKTGMKIKMNGETGIIEILEQ